MARDASIGYYERRFRTMTVKPAWDYAVKQAVKTIKDNLSAYRAVAEESGVPWPFVALVHYMEASGDLRKQTLNGQPWNRRTTIHPPNLGPWKSFHEAACFGFQQARANAKGFPNLTKLEPNAPSILYHLERWNGLGYAKNGMDSEYLFNGTSHDPGDGKYTSDGKYSSRAKNSQVGGAAILLGLVREPLWQPGEVAWKDAPPWPVEYDPKGYLIREAARQFQRGLNQAIVQGGAPYHVIDEDGWAQKETSEALFVLTGQYLKGDPRGAAK